MKRNIVITGAITVTAAWLGAQGIAAEKHPETKAASGLDSRQPVVVFIEDTSPPEEVNGGVAANCVFPPVGPDVIVGDLDGVANYPSQNGIEAFSVGTVSCNIGDVWLNWSGNTNQHPVIGQNFFRLRTVDGTPRFEQIGQSWLKHGFFALSEELCCDNCSPTDGTHLGVGCSDPYTAQRNGGQASAGPKWQVNAYTGFFPFPPANPPFSGSVARRLQIPISELEESGPDSTSRYFVEGQYVTPDDAAAGNQNNNASFREVLVSGSGTAWNFSLTGQTFRTYPGVRAWKRVDPSVHEAFIQVPEEGLFILAYKATEMQNGMWHYEYALYNMNSDRSGRSLTFDIPDCVTLTNIEFHDVEYHSGDGPGNANFSGDDWSMTRQNGQLTWTTESFDDNPSANALRWGTMYTFRFDSPSPPAATPATLGLFKPGTPDAVQFLVRAPQSGAASDCPADAAPSGGDGQVNVEDLLMVINNWGNPGGPGDVEPPCGDGEINVADLLAVINAWGPCP